MIITYYDSTNYGAFLQAYSTQQFLMSHDVDAEIYEYNSLSAKILGGLYKLTKCKKVETKEKVDYRNAMGQAVIDQQYLLRRSKGLGHYDLAILGSDEIWNVKNLNAAHDSFLFCKFKRADKTVSYAACAGASSKKHLSFFPYAAKGIRSLDAVAVRDDQTENLVKSIGRKDVVRVLDPSFLYDFEQELPDLNISEPYLFVYSYGLSENQVKEIKAVAHSRNWKIIATGANYEWANDNPAPTPFEWLSYLKNAEAVVTTTFHGSAFAIHFNKTFAVYNFKSAKVQSLLKEMKLLDRRVSSWNSLEHILNEPIDYAKVNTIIMLKLRAAESFLLSQLGLQNDEYTVQIDDDPSNGKMCYVARHKDRDIRLSSRSGGAFTAISDVVFSEGGVIYGAMLDEKFQAYHGRATTAEERDRMRGSKYVQSNLSMALPLILKDLSNSRTVLFTGTPCQADAVRKMASAKHLDGHLLTLDFICHGVPSPLIWREYLSTYPNVTGVDFRNKKKFGWKAHVETINSNGREVSSNIYTKLYHSNYCVRPSCHECPYAQYERFSDITIADCWGTESAAPGFNSDDSGVSMILPNTCNGEEIVRKALEALETREVPLIKMQQPVLKCEGMGTCNPSDKRDQFWTDFHDKGIEYVCKHYSTANTNSRLKNMFKLPHSIRFAIKKFLRRV